jgi:hypothetical protein
MAGIGTAPGGAVLAEDICDFQFRASHRRRRLCRLFLPPARLGRSTLPLG